jgi:hypothetical protein
MAGGTACPTVPWGPIREGGAFLGVKHSVLFCCKQRTSWVRFVILRVYQALPLVRRPSPFRCPVSVAESVASGRRALYVEDCRGVNLAHREATRPILDRNPQPELTHGGSVWKPKRMALKTAKPAGAAILPRPASRRQFRLRSSVIWYRAICAKMGSGKWEFFPKGLKLPPRRAGID